MQNVERQWTAVANSNLETNMSFINLFPSGADSDSRILCAKPIWCNKKSCFSLHDNMLYNDIL
jgi:hypothetical protein